jgi:hypothetical protein
MMTLPTMRIDARRVSGTGWPLAYLSMRAFLTNLLLYEFVESCRSYAMTCITIVTTHGCAISTCG